MFGRVFIDQYGTEPNIAWIEMAAELTDAQCRRGFVAIKESGRSFAPSLPDFRSACIHKRTGSPRLLGAPALPEPDTSHFRKLRSMRDAALKKHDYSLMRQLDAQMVALTLKHARQSRPLKPSGDER